MQISAEEFLDFAENAIVSETKEGIVNAVSNLKRTLDCEMYMFFESINIKRTKENKGTDRNRKSIDVCSAKNYAVKWEMLNE